MPSLTLDEIKKYSPFSTLTFVETGTYMGNTVNNVKSYFDTVYSIEINENYANKAIERFKSNDNVHIIKGDSSVEIEKLCKNIDTPTFFWLDGHWSGGDTGKGDKDCPLIEEINHIVNFCKNKCIIAIDDVRLFGTKINEDWSYISRETLLKIVEPRLESCNYYPSECHPEDRMVLVLKKKLI
jgi:hypothetical protein